MNSTLLAKIFGWAQFGLQTLGQVTVGGLPHGAMGWIGLAGSLLAAIGIHAASNSPGNQQPTPTQQFGGQSLQGTGNIKQ